MGYTHYFQQNREVTVEEWAAIIADAKLLVEKGGVPLWSEYNDPDTKPVIDGHAIKFNGCEDDGHETFYLQRELYQEFNFCKTARKPYDLIVCSILIAAEHHAPGAWDIGSDGGFTEDDDEWYPAFRLANTVLGKKVINDIEPQYEVPPGVRR